MAMKNFTMQKLSAVRLPAVAKRKQNHAQRLATTNALTSFSRCDKVPRKTARRLKPITYDVDLSPANTQKSKSDSAASGSHQQPGMTTTRQENCLVCGSSKMYFCAHTKIRHSRWSCLSWAGARNSRPVVLESH